MPNDEPSHEPRHPIRVVAERTGLTPSVLRAWERRYGVVEPGRSDAGQRLYSDADVERIALIVKAVNAGRSVGQVAALEPAALRALVAEDAERSVARPTLAQDFRQRAFAAVTELDPGRLQTVLRSALFTLGALDYLSEVAAPLLRRIGEAWHAGELGIAHEHAASAVMRGTLEWLLTSLDAPEHAPVVVLACPAQERHELGAMLAAGVAAYGGWRVVYLGADVPAPDIASAARQHGARAVGVSVIAPPNLDVTRSELAILRDQLPHRTALIVGGSSAAALDHLAPGIETVRDLDHWATTLRGAA